MYLARCLRGHGRDPRNCSGHVTRARSAPPAGHNTLSLQDGYAVVASDGTGTFPLAGEVRAGGAAVTVAPGSVAYITTGAPVPAGADAVIQIENTERVPGAPEVTILKAATAGQDIRTVGSDITKVPPPRLACALPRADSTRSGQGCSDA